MKTAFNLMANLLTALGTFSLSPAASVTYSHELPPASTAGNLLAGRIPTKNTSWYYDSGGLEKITNGSFEDNGWSQATPWDLTFFLGESIQNLGSVDIWIEDADPSRWYLPSGQVSVSFDHNNWSSAASVDNSTMSGTRTSPDAEINRIHVKFAAGEVPSFHYLRISGLATGNASLGLTPRIKEITAFRWVPEPGTFEAAMHNAGLTGAAAAIAADPDGDGAANLLEYAAGSDPSQGGSAPARPVAGTSGSPPDGPRLTLTVRLAKPLPADILVTCEFSEDLGLTDPWSPTGVEMADEDMGSYIKRVFTAPHVIGQPARGFMRAKVSQQ